MAVYPYIAYDPKIHKPWLEKITDSKWWRIRSLNYLVGSPYLVESYVDIAYSDNLEELSIWADLNGVPVVECLLPNHRSFDIIEQPKGTHN